jgi:class 3 adenylate cyclase/tetratricopeptide (TPR) repeat protein
MFCSGCGSALVLGSKFCSICGQPQVGTVRTKGEDGSPSPERRQITALFCDLVGAVRKLDTALVEGYQKAAGDAVRRFEGAIAQFQGGGLMVYFGYPTAHEDDPTRALLTALSILDALIGLNNSFGDEQANQLHVRMGIHTGLVVVGNLDEMGRQVQFGIGDAPSIATRLQGIAQTDSIVVSGESRQLMRGQYLWTDLGAVEFRGVNHSLQAFSLQRHVRSSGVAWSHLEARSMVGRDAELATLRAAMVQAQSGKGVVVTICAEAGMGKSLLLAQLLQDVESGQGRSQLIGCSPYHASTEFHAFEEWMETCLGIEPEDSAALRFCKLSQGLPAQENPDDLLLMAALLSIALPADKAAPNVTPAVAKQRTDAVVAAWLMGQGSGVPMVVCEDVHWADPTTLGFLAWLASQPLLLVLTFRPEFTSPQLLAIPGLIRVDLQRLPNVQGQAIIHRVAGGKVLPPAIVQTILANTDGVPFFVEEFTRSVLESGHLIEKDDHFELAGDLPAGLIPSSLRDSLTARLDRLGPARSLVRHAAVIGRRFDIDLLDAIVPEGAPAVADGLRTLSESGLAHPINAARGEYEFQHALIQVAAYESMLRRERVDMHARVAARIDEVFPELAERQPALVARHLTESRQWSAAVKRWLVAGGRSLARSANLEAIVQLKEGLALLPNLRPQESAPLELALLTTMGPALIATTGFASAAVGETYARTRQLCDVLGDQPEAFPSLWGSWVYNHVRGNCAVGLQYAKHMLRMGEKTGHDGMLVEAWWTLGDSHYWLGDIAESDRCLAIATTIYDPQRHAVNAMYYGQDPGVAAECYRSYTLWMLGHPDQSLAALERCRTLAAQRNHVFSTAWSLAFEFMVYMYRRQPGAALESVDRTLAFCVAQGTPFWISAGYVVRGWARALLGESKAGIEEMQQGMAMYEMIGSLVVQPLWYALLAEALMQANRYAEARTAIDTGLAKAWQNEEKVSEIELWVAQGDLDQLQYMGEPERARISYHKALDLASACGARSLALRAALRLHPLLVLAEQVQISTLPALLDSFTEGHDTPDWQAARTALQLPV